MGRSKAASCATSSALWNRTSTPGFTGSHCHVRSLGEGEPEPWVGTNVSESNLDSAFPVQPRSSDVSASVVLRHLVCPGLGFGAAPLPDARVLP